MKNLSIASIYVAFFLLIGFTVYFTKSGTPLWALLLTPTISFYKNDNEK